MLFREMTELSPSIFNHVIGPIMRGPSSSHTAASVRIGLLGRKLLGEPLRKAEFFFDPEGSLATTYRGQGSAMGLAAGLLGMDIADRAMIDAEAICRERGIDLVFNVKQYEASHPNTYKIQLLGEKGKIVRFTALSTGGGLIRLTHLDGNTIEDDTPYVAPLLPVSAKEKSQLPFASIDELLQIVAKKGGMLGVYALAYEAALGGVDEKLIKSLCLSHLNVMRESFHQGLQGTSYDDRILPRQSQLIETSVEQDKLIPAELTNAIITTVTAIMETKSSMGAIVAAPTAGSCGALPGGLLAVGGKLSSTDDQLMGSLLAAGLVGVFIAQKGGFAAEEGGCQYECGAASGMTAAALVDLMGGDADVALRAASIALQNTLGMICDPVADRVEVPCLGKNIMAALNGLAAANMALAGFSHVIPLDQVIDAMQEVGEGMGHRYKCTCKGGLSITPEAQRIDFQLRNLHSEKK